MARRWLLLAALVCMTTQVSAQRVFKTIKPDEVDDTLKFDVNSVPVRSVLFQGTAVLGTTVERAVYDNSILASGSVVDLNFCPNVVFSPNSTKGFVSFPGSDKVMVFNPKTGDIISILQVDKNPGQLVISPDGKTVLVLCLLLERNIPSGQGQNFDAEEVATLAAIDVDSLEVRTLDLTQVWFSFYNNILFSPDGHTAYVASMRTDELLRFDVDTLTEIQPRLEFRTGGWPASLTMAPDGSFMTAVLTNSQAVNIREHPDSIAFVDREGFRITRELAPPTGSQQEDQNQKVLQNFTAMNNVALTPDGKYGIVGDEAFSWILPDPETTLDRTWVFDVGTGEFKLYLAYGPVTSVFTAPDGRFVVPGSLYFTFIDPAAETVAAVQPLFTHSGFLPRNSVVFSADGSLMYYAVPYYDTLDDFNLVTNEFPVSTPIGGPVDFSGLQLSSAPLQLQFTPDHQVLVSVNFNANTLDLIENTTHMSIARAISNESFFTGVAFTNPSVEDAHVVVTGYSDAGAPITDDAGTEDIVEFVNPQDVTIPPGNQLAETAEEVLSAAEGQTISGWFDIDSDRADLRSFSLIGDRQLKRLDGVTAARGTSVQFVVPEVRVTDGFDTQLVVLNRNIQSAGVQAQLFDSAGELLETFSTTVPRRTPLVSFLRDPDPTDTATSGLFSEAAFEDFVDGYVVVTAQTGVIAFERYFDDERMSVLDCTPIGDRDPKPTRFFVPQVVEFEGNDTMLKLVNSHPIPPEEPADGSDPIDPETLKLEVQLSLEGNDGQDLAAPVTVELAAGQSIRKSVAELFGLEDTGEVVSGWILVDVDQAGLVGSAEFQVYGGKGMSTVPFQAAPSSQMIFSHVAQGSGLSTGLVLINPGSADANVTLQVFRSDGTINSSAELQVPAGGRIAGLLPDLLEGLGEQLGGYVKVDSDSDLVGLELFYADSLEYIAAVEAQ